MAVGAITGPMLAAENVRCEVPIQIARNDQVQTSIAIVVDETSSGAPTASSHSRLGRNIRKSPVAIVVVQSVPTDISDQQVRVSVIVVVPGRYSHTVSSALHPCGFRNVGNSAVAAVLIQSVPKPRIGAVAESARDIVASPPLRPRTV